MQPTQTHTNQFISDLDAGIFEQKIGRFLSDIAANVVEYGKKGRLVLTFDFERMADSSQVLVSHKLDAQVPTKNGKVREENLTKTPMSVNAGGRITLFPEHQGQLFETQK